MQGRGPRAAIAAVAVAVLAPPVAAQEEPVALHGFAQVNWSARTTGRRPGTGGHGDFLIAEERLQLELGHLARSGAAEFLVKVDVAHDALIGEGRVELREAYLDAALGRLGVRAGRQIVTWGVGDLLFVSDAFPKDWSAFFSGRPVEYLKLASDALRLDLRGGALSIDLVVVPVFRPDRAPDADRLVLPDPFGGLPRETRTPEARLANAQVALRLRRRIGGADVALSAYRGFYGLPAPRPTGDGGAGARRVAETYPRLHLYALAARRPVTGGLLSAELGYFGSREDPGGGDPWIPNSEIRGLVGYQRPFGRDGVLGVQYYVEWMLGADRYRASLPGGLPAREEVRQVAMLRVVRYGAYQLWEFSGVAFYGLSSGDFLLTPAVRHRIGDELRVSVGANVFGGEDTGPFGALDANDHVFVVARYTF